MFNSTKLVYDLNKLKIKDSNRLITVDIKDLHINLPIIEIILHHKNLEI